MKRFALVLLPGITAALAAAFALRGQAHGLASAAGILVFGGLFAFHAYAHAALAFLGAMTLLLALSRGSGAASLRGALPAATTAGCISFLVLPWRPVSLTPVVFGLLVAAALWFLVLRPTHAAA